MKDRTNANEIRGDESTPNFTLNPFSDYKYFIFLTFRSHTHTHTHTYTDTFFINHLEVVHKLRSRILGNS